MCALLKTYVKADTYHNFPEVGADLVKMINSMDYHVETSGWYDPCIHEFDVDKMSFHLDHLSAPPVGYIGGAILVQSAELFPMSDDMELCSTLATISTTGTHSSLIEDDTDDECSITSVTCQKECCKTFHDLYTSIV